ncbi:MAG: iron-sulfur cluster assembly scaffold protein [Bacteroidota bacterium]|nr:iron-sulfur cluster assembly scaffold protein [Bacteroidota bacterium]
MYREIILDHYKNPRNFGQIKNANAQAKKKNFLCGDEMTMDFKLSKNGKIEDVKFHGAGCSVSRAGGSILTEAIKGMTMAQFKKYSDKDFLKDMKAPITPARKKCALLALETARLALKTKPTKKK